MGIKKGIMKHKGRNALIKVKYVKPFLTVGKH